MILPYFVLMANDRSLKCRRKVLVFCLKPIMMSTVDLRAKLFSIYFVLENCSFLILLGHSILLWMRERDSLSMLYVCREPHLSVNPIMVFPYPRGFDVSEN
jgi:hypothetical protein